MLKTWVFDAINELEQFASKYDKVSNGHAKTNNTQIGSI